MNRQAEAGYEYVSLKYLDKSTVLMVFLND